MCIEFTARETCPLCGSNEKRILVKSEFKNPIIFDFVRTFYKSANFDSCKDSSFRIARCGCGFVWQIDVLNDEGMALLYEAWIDVGESHEKRTAAKLSYFQGLSRNLARCKAMLADVDEPKSFDYGMGWGTWAVMASAFGFDSYGHELSPVRISYAEGRGIKCIKKPKDCSPESFHLINAEQVLEHIPNPKETFELFCKLLAKDGVLQVAVPDGTREISELEHDTWRPRKGAAQPLEHINTFTPQTLAAMGEAVGLEVIKAPLVIACQATLSMSFLPLPLYLKLARTRIFFRKCHC